MSHRLGSPARRQPARVARQIIRVIVRCVLTKLKKALLVGGVSPGDVAAQYIRGPATELYAALRLNAVAYGDNYIQAVESDGTVGICNVQKMHVTTFDQLFFIKDVANMAPDDTDFATKQRRHVLCV